MALTHKLPVPRDLKPAAKLPRLAAVELRQHRHPRWPASRSSGAPRLRRGRSTGRPPTPGDTLLAEDTIPYGVVNPRPANPADHARGRFITMHPGGGIRNTESRHERQDIYAKMGTVLTEEWDNYGWPAAQPVKDGPMTIKPGPEFPKLIYCPNVEQTGRGMGAYRQGVPEWAVVDDPFRAVGTAHVQRLPLQHPVRAQPVAADPVGGISNIQHGISNRTREGAMSTARLLIAILFTSVGTAKKSTER
jgi:hypothetical protein